ncbi:MAG: epimerase, partial [Candidatus Levybacteria bacterium CG10_big_fil_rev_8_21_14_0_10_36_7]
MSKKIFVTGVAGFLGSHLADQMLLGGHKVVGCDNLVGGDKGNVPKGVHFFESDCSDLKEMVIIMKDCDVVYHCAALAPVGLSVFSPYTITHSIVDATVSVLSAAVQNSVKRFIFCSSMDRYGKNQVPFTEDMRPEPQDPYGVAKVAAEEFVKNICSTFGIEHVIVVPHNIIGTRQKYDDPFRNVVSIMINMMLQGRQPIIYGDGEQKRSFCFVSDCIYSLEKCLDDKRVVGQIINIGNDDNFMTINELAKKIADVLHFDLNAVYIKDRPQEVKVAYCSVDKARDLLGFRTEK